ncbi:MAG: PadR family transcriptional regulator [Desulfurococcaceae archaeon]
MEKGFETGLDYAMCIEKPFIKGLTRALVLLALKEGRKKGYQIYRYIVNVIGLKTSLSTTYTILRELTNKGFIERSGDLYHLTEKGMNALQAFISRFNKIKLFLEESSKHIKST